MKTYTSVSLLILSALFVLLSSCTKAMDNFDTQLVNKQWLQNPVCAFPCWQNITPQETNFEDVIPILQDAKVDIDFIDEDSVSLLFEETISGSVTKASDGVVDHIILDVHDDKLTITDLEQIIGTPEKVALTWELYTSDCMGRLLYPDSGTIIDVAYLENNSRSRDKLDCQVDITSDSKIFRIVLIGSKFDSSELWKKSPYSNLDYMEWKGYGTYP